MELKNEIGRTIITENEVINADSNISLDNIYRAIAYLKPEHQANILMNFKLTELYSIFANNAGYEKYIDDLFAASKEYTDRAVALLTLHTEIFIQSRKQEEKFDPAVTMCQMFDRMTEADQKRFCEGMFQKKGFFEDAYKRMMDTFQDAIENEKENNNVAGSDGNVETEM